MVDDVSSGRILFVEDHGASRMAMEKLLSRLGYTVDVAGSGAEALELIEEKGFALAIIDYMLPGMNGVELFERIRVLSPETKGILLTGHMTSSNKTAALEAGMERVLAKPLAIEALVPIIQEAIGERAVSRRQ